MGGAHVAALRIDHANGIAGVSFTAVAYVTCENPRVARFDAICAMAIDTNLCGHSSSLVRGGRDGRNVRRVDGGGGRSQDSRCGHRAGLVHVRSLRHERAMNRGLRNRAARKLPGLFRSLQSRVHPRDHHGGCADGRRAENPNDRRAESLCGRNLPRGHGRETRGSYDGFASLRPLQ